MKSRILLLIAGLMCGIASAHNSPQQMDCPHMQDVQRRGDEAMGFDHMKATHHFFLSNSGGAIQVTANDAKDLDSMGEIRTHLGHITKIFADGNFEIPMLVHGQTPPGTEAMKQLKSKISYKYEEIERGAKILISSQEPAALNAIHEFLTFQIKDHQTGDSLDVTN
jgi:hypothetical protein